jgi:large subunit ribosomal protein L25
MSVIQLNGTRRTVLGKGGARKARAAGDIPAVLYGHGETPVAVAVNHRDFTIAMRVHKGGNALVSLKLDGGEVTALLRDAQVDPLSRAIIHLDFQHISLTEMVEVQVAVHAAGLALGVKDGGGILEIITRHLEVRCLPTAIPTSIDVDVTALNVGDSIHVRDIKVEGLMILSDPEATVIAVVAPAVEEVAPAEDAAVAAPTTAEPEVVGAKGKKDEEAPAAGAEKEEKKKDDKKKDEKKK